MRNIHAGDFVFDIGGNPVQVIAETEVMKDHDCYRVIFDDGSQIVADAGHLWATLVDAERSSNLRRTQRWRENRKAKRPKRGTGKRPDLAAANGQRKSNYLQSIPPQIRTTKQIHESLCIRGRANHSIDLAVIKGSDIRLDIKPYTLGAWLGDGTSQGGAITCADQDIIDRIMIDGYGCRKHTSKYGFGILGLKKQLRQGCLINNKHIPAKYFISSVENRIELVRGLMDTDGTVSRDGRLCIGFVNEGLTKDVKQLLETLGIKCAISVGNAKINGVVKGKVYRINFSSWFNPFHLARKSIRYATRAELSQASKRYIVGCEKIESVPVKCIQIANADGMWLCGKEAIPTHNSHLIRIAAIMWALVIPGLQIYIFRRTYDDLIKNHMEGPTGFHALLAPWLGKYVDIVDKEIRFNNKSKIYLCHCQHEKNRFDYQGAEIHVLLIDELTHFTETIYRFLRSRVRMPQGMKIPDEYQDLFPRILCGSNPGGVGHQWVKATFIDSGTPFQIYRTPDKEGGFKRQFIPANLADNPSMDQERYKANLTGLGNEALVKAMLDGDWDIVAGAAFSIDRNIHMLRAFTPPRHWVRFTSMDWGFTKPYSVGWYCVAEGGTMLEGKNGYPDRFIPDGAVIRYRELYGSTGKADEGVRENSETVVAKILAIEKQANERMDYRIADTQLWAKNDGKSSAERMFDESNRLLKEGKAIQSFSPRGCEKDRQANFVEVCNRLNGVEVEDGQFMPMFYVTDNCLNWWRTVPSLILDEVNPEKGPDEKQELHAFDDTQYALQSRPFKLTAQQRNDAIVKMARRQHKLHTVDPYRTKPIIKRA